MIVIAPHDEQSAMSCTNLPAELHLQVQKANIDIPMVDWLKQEYDPGHGHSIAIWAVFKDEGWVQSSKK